MQNEKKTSYAMRIAVVVPAHNEAPFIKECLHSFLRQTQPPEALIVVDDNSTDATYELATSIAQNHPWISVVQHPSSVEHLPGEKVIRAFNHGAENIWRHFDLIGKFDADIILPPNYFEEMRSIFRDDRTLGMCSGLLHIHKKGKWAYEAIAKKNHVRGPIKLYRRQAFELMGGLRLGVGWDTVDTLLCQYHGYGTRTVPTLQVKHLRPTGHGYHSKNHRAKGEALYKMRYGIPLAKLALLKMAWQSKSPRLYIQGVMGYLNASFRATPKFVNRDQGKFIRKKRWKDIKTKVTSR